MEVTTLYTIPAGGADSIVIPDTLIEGKHLVCDTTSLTYLTHADYIEKSELYTAGTPQYYTRHTNQYHLLPAPTEDSEIYLTYYAEIDELQFDSDSNIILGMEPELYLMLMAYYAEIFLADDTSPARAQVYMNEAMVLLSEINTQAEKEEASVSPLQIRPKRAPRRTTRMNTGYGRT